MASFSNFAFQNNDVLEENVFNSGVNCVSVCTRSHVYVHVCVQVYIHAHALM